MGRPEPGRRVVVKDVGQALADTGELPEAQRQLRRPLDRYAACVESNGGLSADSGKVTLRFLVRERGRAEGVSVKDRQRRLARCRQMHRRRDRSTLRGLPGGADCGRDVEHRARLGRRRTLTSSPTMLAENGSPRVGAPALPGRVQRYQAYQRRSAEYRVKAQELARRSGLLSNLRGLSFAALAVGFISAAVSEDATLGLSAGFAAAAAFAVFVVWHARILSAEDEAWRFWRVNENAASRAQDEWQSLPEDGAEFQDPEHPNSGDLDVFGPRSLFQFINVAHTTYGQAALARCLAGGDSLDAIIARQEAVRELEPKLDFRQALEAYTLRAAEPPGAARLA